MFPGVCLCIVDEIRSKELHSDLANLGSECEVLPITEASYEVSYKGETLISPRSSGYDDRCATSGCDDSRLMEIIDYFLSFGETFRSTDFLPVVHENRGIKIVHR